MAVLAFVLNDAGDVFRIVHSADFDRLVARFISLDDFARRGSHARCGLVLRFRRAAAVFVDHRESGRREQTNQPREYLGRTCGSDHRFSKQINEFDHRETKTGRSGFRPDVPNDTKRAVFLFRFGFPKDRQQRLRKRRSASVSIDRRTLDKSRRVGYLLNKSGPTTISRRD